MDTITKLTYTLLFICLAFLILLIAKYWSNYFYFLTFLAFILSRAAFYDIPSQTSNLENKKIQKISFVYLGLGFISLTISLVSWSFSTQCYYDNLSDTYLYLGLYTCGYFIGFCHFDLALKSMYQIRKRSRIFQEIISILT